MSTLTNSSISSSITHLLNSSSSSLSSARDLHSLISSSPIHLSNTVLTTKLITTYSNLKSPHDSRALFDSLPNKNLYQYNAMLSAYSKNELFQQSLDLFCLMLSTTDLLPDNFTLPCVLKSCAHVFNLNFGKCVHGLGLKLGLSQDAFVANSLINMYGKCGCVDDACIMFEKMCDRNVVSWNSMISGLFENGYIDKGFDMFVELLEVNEMKVDDATLVTLLPVCATEGLIGTGRLMHGLALKLGLESEVNVNNALIDMYSKCACLDDAWRLFRVANTKNVVSWNVMIGGCARNEGNSVVFDVLRDMVIEEGVKANEITILNVLTTCSDPLDVLKVKELHGYVLRHGFQVNELLSNALIASYAKFGSLELAKNVFDMMEMKTINSWNAIVGGCAQNGDPRKAVELFFDMIAVGLEPDWFSIGSLLLACAHTKFLELGKSIHGFVQRNGLEVDSFIMISLISLYVQCGKPAKARILFDGLEKKDLVSWNAMIAGYSQNDLPNETIILFRKMLQNGYNPTTISTTSVFTACAQLSTLRIGKEMHCFALKVDFIQDSHVGSSIIDMYAKCGSIEHATYFYNNMHKKDLVSYNVMIMGYGIHGQATEAIGLLDAMWKEEIKADAYTYIGILMACSHAGLVEEGLNHFDEMENKHNIAPKQEHYCCVVDMLGRAGNFNEAMKLIEEMPEEPDSRIWSALLSACKIHNNIDTGEIIVDKLLELEPNTVEHYIMASNLFAGSKRWDDVRRVRKKLKEKGLIKDPGCSWIEMDGNVYNFKVGDENRDIWCDLEERIRKIGYVPNIESVLHEVEDEEKVDILRSHSEKQALVFGLINMKEGMKITICKNIRMCKDCHNAFKLVAKVEGRDIVVRDNKRFHHFRDGFCSCADYCLFFYV